MLRGQLQTSHLLGMAAVLLAIDLDDICPAHIVPTVLGTCRTSLSETLLRGVRLD